MNEEDRGFVIKTDGDDARQRARARKSSRVPHSAYAAAIVVAALMIGYALYRSAVPGNNPAERPDAAGQQVRTESADADGNPTEISESASSERIVPDDGQLLWASPTVGPPISLTYVPAGVRLLLHFRPAKLMEHAQGAKTLAALGPWGERTIEELERRTHAKLNEMESLLVAVLPIRNEKVDVALRVGFVASIESSEVIGRFDGATQDDGAGFIVKEENGVTTMVVFPESFADDLAEVDEALLPRDLTTLIRHTDADRTATVVFDPRFLKASGTDVFSGAAAVLHDVVEQTFRREAAAVALSLNVQDSLFLETRVVPAVNMPPHRYAAQLRSRLDRAPIQIAEQVGRYGDDAYGRKLVGRLPEMIRQANRFVRVGADGDQSLMRCYLPVEATHNLLAAAELLISSPGRAGGQTSSATDASLSQDATTDILARRLSFRLQRESLEDALDMLAAEAGIAIEIRGADLEADGITRNQMVDVDLSDRSISEILTAIMQAANPDRSSTGPADPRQKLVFVLQTAADGAEGSSPVRIIVTTRAAALERGDNLPRVFSGPAADPL